MEKEEARTTTMETFNLFRQFCSEIAGEEAAINWLAESHRLIREYFKNLDRFVLDKQANLQEIPEAISDKEVLAFSVWMQQFINLLKGAYIGIGKIKIEEITAPVKEPLEEMGFYTFYEQAEELVY